MLLLLSFLLLIYLKYGLICLSQIVIGLLIFFFSNILIGLNPWDLKYYIIRSISILSILAVLYVNLEDSFSLFFILPFSKDRISFLIDFPSEIEFEKFNKTEFNLNQTYKIKNFLKHDLSDLDNYVGYVCLSYTGYGIYLSISEFILFNKYSDAEIIETFIEDNLIDQECLIIEKGLSEYDRSKVKITFYYAKFSII